MLRNLLAHSINFLINHKLSGEVQVCASVTVLFKNDKRADLENTDYGYNNNRQSSEKTQVSFREENTSNAILGKW